VIVVISAEGSVALTEPSEFRGFKVVAAPEVDIDEALRRNEAGRSSGDAQVLISVSWLLEQVSELANHAEWRSSFQAMVSYAESRGWLQDHQIAAHVEWSPSATD
jgi:hypothetical protein